MVRPHDVPLFPVASNAAFYVVFGVFVVAFLVLAVITATWAIRHDRVGLAEWRRRRVAEGIGLGAEASGRPLADPVRSNGSSSGRSPAHPPQPQRGGRKPPRGGATGESPDPGSPDPADDPGPDPGPVTGPG